MLNSRDKAVIEAIHGNRGANIVKIYKNAKRIQSRIHFADVMESLQKQIKNGRVVEENGIYKVDKNKLTVKPKTTPKSK